LTLGCIGHTKKSVPTPWPPWLAGGQRRPAYAGRGQLRLAMASVGGPAARLGHSLSMHENAQVGLSEGHDENKQKKRAKTAKKRAQTGHGRAGTGLKRARVLGPLGWPTGPKAPTHSGPTRKVQGSVPYTKNNGCRAPLVRKPMFLSKTQPKMLIRCL